MHSEGMSITPEVVKAARERVGESQTAFAARFGVDQTTVHRWETKGVPSRGAAGKAIERVLSDLAQDARA